MKNLIKLITLFSFILVLVCGCSKKPTKQNNVKTQTQNIEQNVQNTTPTNNNDILSELIVNDEEVNSNQNVSEVKSTPKQEIQIVEDDTDYNSLEFDRHENIVFDCNYVSDATQKDGDITILITKIKGAISGLPGTYELYVPYSLDWKRGDKALVNYDIYYMDEYHIVIRDIEFLQKINNEYIERQKEIQAQKEAEQRALEEAQRLAEEEAQKLAQEEQRKKEAAEKKKAQQAAQKKASQQAAQQAAAQQAAQQVAEAQAVEAQQRALEAQINALIQ